jgi:asparagine synthase (glutamine-hydrolysing)
MCGIIGVSASNSCIVSKYREEIVAGSDRLNHRGPDSFGFFENNRIILGHRRLSIFDTSSNGSQPMVSNDGNWIIILNGEIYNFKELRDIYLLDNKGKLKSQSDTEVLLECIVKLGVESTLSHVRGMYAFCVHNIRDNKTYLCRDPFGEKPLYYHTGVDGLFFASDLRALPGISGIKEIDRKVVNSFLRFGYCSGDSAIIKGVKKLLPGQILTYENDHVTIQNAVSFSNIISQSSDFEDYSIKYNRFRNVVLKSVIERSKADVPVGVLLSGGVDSSLIASILARQQKIETFNLSFEERAFDEGDVAFRVSKFIGSNHNVLKFSAKDALDLIPKIPSVFSEPFADISLLPTLAICEFARKKVTVGLSGDGGDEFLFGYKKYFQQEKILRLKRFANFFSQDISMPDFMSKIIGEKKLKFINEVFKRDANLNLMFSSYQRDLKGLVMSEGGELSNVYTADYQNSQLHLNARLADILQYLPDNILVKTDRSSMYNSLELRAPFLDLDLMKESFKFTKNELYKNGVGKLPLRQMLAEFLPLDVYDVSEKRGFSIPIQLWLSNELRPLIEWQLSSEKIKSDQIFDYSKVEFYKDQFYRKNQNYSQLLWSILIFNLWFDEYFSK